VGENAMVNGGEQQPSGVMGLRARGLRRGRRPASGQRLPRLAGRRSSAGYVTAGLAVLALLGAWSLGVAGCTAGGPGYTRMEAASDSVLAKMRQSPGEISRLQANAHYYKLMGQPELGLKEMELAHQQNPDNLQIVNLLAQNYEELGKFEAARQLYQEALTRHGSQPAIANNLCFSYYQEGRWQEAETCFRETLARDPNNVAARNNLGLLYCRLGRQDEARRVWQESPTPAPL
jgi:tetratricopeptide (TPR) repeat protein